MVSKSLTVFRTIVLVMMISVASLIQGRQAAKSAPSPVLIALIGTDHFTGKAEFTEDKLIADTIMLLMIDPSTQAMAVVSINPDTYLNIPTYNKPDRISHSVLIGERLQYPGGSSMLTVKTIEQYLTVKIDHYVTVNFDLYNTVIDVLAPIRVCPKLPLHDDKLPDIDLGSITVDFQPGCQDMDAKQILQYTRAFRKNDADRRARQQEVLLAIRDKVQSLGGVAKILANSQNILDAVKKNLNTDLSFQDIVDLMQVVESIPPGKIKFVTLSEQDGYLTAVKQADGSYYFIPLYGKTRNFVRTLLKTAATGNGNK